MKTKANTIETGDRVRLVRPIVRHGIVVVPFGTEGTVTKAIQVGGPFTLSIAVRFDGQPCADDFSTDWPLWVEVIRKWNGLAHNHSAGSWACPVCEDL